MRVFEKNTVMVALPALAAANVPFVGHSERIPPVGRPVFPPRPVFALAIRKAQIGLGGGRITRRRPAVARTTEGLWDSGEYSPANVNGVGGHIKLEEFLSWAYPGKRDDL